MPVLKRSKYQNEDNILRNSGYTHLLNLAHVALISERVAKNQSSLCNYPTFSSSCNLVRGFMEVPTSYSFEIGAYSWWERDQYATLQISSNLHPVLTKERKEIFEKEWIKRNKQADTTQQEADVMATVTAASDEKTDEVAYLRASCEPSLFPYKLLNYYRGKLSILESCEEQTLFELALYRSAALTHGGDGDPYQSDRFFPLINEMQQKGFREEVKRFIEEGIDRYFFRQPNQKPKVLAATLFIRLACRLSKFNQGVPIVDSLELIEKMMAVPTIKQEERALLCLHQILAYGSLKEWTPEAVEKIFSAWVYYKNTAMPENWRNPLLLREVETLIHSASRFLSTDQESSSFHRSLLKTSLKQLGLDLPDAYQINAEEPHIITGRGDDGSFWSVNILSGEVLAEDGILKRTFAPNGLQDATFKYIFGDIQPCYFETSNCYYFSHPTLGTFRAIKTYRSRDVYGHYDDTYAIQKESKGQWYQYVRPADCLQSIPRFLCGDKTHWINTNDSRSDMIICDRMTGAILTTIQPGGLIQDKQMTYWGGVEGSFLTQFERHEYIHWSINKAGKQILTFWRYQSHGHHPLSFELNKGELIFTGNRKYRLSQKQKPGLLGATNGSLVLVNPETGEEKVIVALQSLRHHTPLSTRHEIDVQDAHVSYDSLGEFHTDQKSRFEYLEFDVKNGSLVPMSQEGTLYLVYQYLAQRRYEEAFLFLKQVDFRDTLSKSSQDLLRNTIGIAKLTDTSPEAAAVALHAWVVLEKASRRMRAEGKAFNAPPGKNKIVATYSRFEHQIPENLLLHYDDRLLCGLRSNGTSQASFFPGITQYLPAPKRTQEDITPLNLPYANTILATGGMKPESYSYNSYHWERIVQEFQRNVLAATEFIPLVATPSTYAQEVNLLHKWTLAHEQGFFTEAYAIARGKQGTTSIVSGLFLECIFSSR